MKLKTMSFATLMMVASSTVYAADANLKTTEQKASYTLAVDLAKNFEKQGLAIDVKAFQLGLEDALSGKEMRLSAEEMNQAVSEVKQQMIQKQLAQREAQGKANAEAGKKFLAENKKKSGVKTLDNGIQYKVLKSGKGESPKAEDTVFAHYEGRFIDGTVFDSSYERGNPLKFSLNGVIKGWSSVIQKMSPGDKWEVAIPSEMAYGEKGAGDVIGPNKTLIFTIELISFDPAKS
ncbi:FKBP-type peptidyl-prolyl cis-trans isomerase [Thiomicrorhabdus indica]|uniref:FKBP-type peptidyl-prolyl cis-trans isomerase n=1 Tax=Thiomicrorhabdus indica TaxID=2267253 RepID=UPI001F0F4805|nr:FKBP-type peptidyl-prolyl cis-trans isomerase [Thiomicrorhabdus indica]